MLPFPLFPLIFPVNQIHHYFNHGVHLFGMALCHHQRESHQGCIRYPLGAVRPVQDAVVLHESEEEGGGNTLVPIHE